MKKIFIIILGILIYNSLFGQSKYEYLNKILINLEAIKKVSYSSKSSVSATGDMNAFNTREKHINMYDNPSDTFLGASFSISSIKKTDEYSFCYDGNYSIIFDWENKKVIIDTLNQKTQRRLFAPFFIRVKTLVNYVKQNIDNTIIRYNNYQDSTIISFIFEDKIAEFWNLKPKIRKSPGKISQYDLIINDKYFPYKLICKMPHQWSWETCSDIKISSKVEFTFEAMKLIPIDFKIQGKQNSKITPTTLEGKIASNWKLKEIYGDSISLRNLKSKVIMIQFSGIGCGHCEESIPFLKQLYIDNKDKDFEHIYIETWSKNISRIESYKDKKELPFKALVSNKKTNIDYKIQGVPVFFILDEKRVIKKVIIGFRKGNTDKEIVNTINKLLQK